MKTWPKQVSFWGRGPSKQVWVKANSKGNTRGGHTSGLQCLSFPVEGVPAVIYGYDRWSSYPILLPSVWLPLYSADGFIASWLLQMCMTYAKGMCCGPRGPPPEAPLQTALGLCGPRTHRPMGLGLAHGMGWAHIMGIGYQWTISVRSIQYG